MAGENPNGGGGWQFVCENQDPSPIPAFDRNCWWDYYFTPEELAANLATYGSYKAWAIDDNIRADLFRWSSLQGDHVECDTPTTGPMAEGEDWVNDQTYRDFAFIDMEYPEYDKIKFGRGMKIYNKAAYGGLYEVPAPENPDQIYYKRGGYNMACHSVSIKNTAATGELASYDYDDWIGVASHDLYKQNWETGLSPDRTFSICLPSQSILFRCYFDGEAGKTIPANTMAVRIRTDPFDAPNFYDLPITQDLPAGEWTLVNLPLENVVIGGTGGRVRITAFKLKLLQAFNVALFDAESKVKLRFANGRFGIVSTIQEPDTETVTDINTPITDVEETYWFTENNGEALSKDFELGLVVDLNRNMVFPASECRFSCAAQIKAGSQTTPAQLPGPLWMGDRDGFINMCFDDKILSWGSPSSRFIYRVASSTNDSVTINRAVEGEADIESLPEYGTVTSLLDKLLVAKVPANPESDIEYRRISFNNEATIYIDGTWTVNPVSSDLIIVGPLAMVVHFSELRNSMPFAARELLGDSETAVALTGSSADSRLDGRMDVEVYGATGGTGRVNDTVPDYQKKTLLTEFQRRWKLHLASKSGRALSYRVKVLQGDNGAVKLRGLAAKERTWGRRM